MKTNAIVRIVLFSVTILILLAILAAGLTLRHWERLLRPLAASSPETAIPERLDSPEAAAPTLAPAGEDALRFPADQIRQLKIEWAAGSVVLVPGDGDAIEVCESGSNSKYPMQVKQQGSTLSIDYCEESLLKGFGINLDRKDLTVSIPRDCALDSLEIETASATLQASGLTVREVEIDTASGECVLESCAVDKLDLDTASGDLRFSGTLEELECDAASGSVCAVLENVPSRIDMDSASGNLDLTLPEDAGFTVGIDGMSSSFTCDFATTVQNGRHVCGNGSCRIQMDAMSGDVIIRKAAAHHAEHDGL